MSETSAPRARTPAVPGGENDDAQTFVDNDHDHDHSNLDSELEKEEPQQFPPPAPAADDADAAHHIDYLQGVSGFRQCIIVLLLANAQLLTQTGLALAIAPIKEIGLTFNTTNPGQLSWLPAAYSLTVGTFILPSGRWGDLLGYKRVFVVGYLWYTVWTLAAGFSAFSHNLIFYSWLRAMQGIGPALLLPNGVAMITHIYPPGKKRNFAISVFGGVAPTGFLFGAWISGMFTQFVWWPWTYWFLGMLMGCLFLLSIWLLPNVRGTGLKNIAELDLEGSFLGVLALVLINFAFNEGPAAGWQKVYVYVLLIVGVLVAGLFAWYESKYAKYPLIPPSAITGITKLVLSAEGFGWASFGIWIYYIWQIYELRGDSILKRTAQQVPTCFAGALAAFLTGLLLHRINPGFVMLISMCAFCVGNILIATVPPHRLYWEQIFVATCVTPFGMDMSFPAGVLIVSEHVEKKYHGMAASLVNTVVNYSISIGLGFAGTVEAHVNHGGQDKLLGYRGALYFAVGIAGAGMLIAVWLIFLVRQTNREHEKRGNEIEQAQA